MLKSGIYDFVICRDGTDMCFVLGFGRQCPDLKQYRISGLTFPLCLTTSSMTMYPYRRASRKAVPLHLSLISHICLYLSICTRHCCCYVTILFNCIAYHCRPLITFPISYAAYTYIIYTTVDPALC